MSDVLLDTECKVECDHDGFWYIIETRRTQHGPFDTEAEARDALESAEGSGAGPRPQEE